MLMPASMRRSTYVALLALGVGACSDGLTSPVGISPDGSAPLMSSGSDAGDNSGSGISGRGQESGTREFTIWPWLPVYEKFGDHVLSMPANVVCDPATSGYGVAFWDLPCAPLQGPIHVTATWSDGNARPVISFSPDLRFAPSDDESRWVKLSLKDSKGINPDLYYAILWFDAEAGQWVDESKADPTLQARTYQSGNMVARRLKHFSDYSLWSGVGSYNVTSGMGGDMMGIGGGW
jgi:hypothetical protein